MVVTPGELAVAIVLLAILEGFRRVQSSEIVITRWRSGWRVADSVWAFWFRKIGWLWIAPFHTSPRIFICSQEASGSGPADKAEIEAVKAAVMELNYCVRKLSLVLTIQCASVFLVLPVVAVFGSSLAVYIGILLVCLCAIVIAVLAWPQQEWHALKYALYPPSSLYAVVDSTIDGLKGHDIDLVIVALLPSQTAGEMLRRHYRSRSFGPDSDPTEREAVRSRTLQLISLRGLNPKDIIGNPKPSSPEVLSFCPCCEAEFVIREGECSDCPGVALMAFTARSKV